LQHLKGAFVQNWIDSREGSGRSQRKGEGGGRDLHGNIINIILVSFDADDKFGFDVSREEGRKL
jgi:hypothetical protein